jgi:hypothetical protein
LLWVVVRGFAYAEDTESAKELAYAAAEDGEGSDEVRCFGVFSYRLN